MEPTIGRKLGTGRDFQCLVHHAAILLERIRVVDTGPNQGPTLFRFHGNVQLWKSSTTTAFDVG